MSDYIDKILWIESYQKLSEDFIRKHKDKLSFRTISERQVLSEDFIREFEDDVLWYDIFRYQKSSEEFIREFQHQITSGGLLNEIATHQKLSESFILENIDHFQNIDEVLLYQDLPETSVVYEHSESNNVQERYDSWLLLDKDIKASKIRKTGKFDCYKDYFEAYLIDIDKNGYPRGDYRHQYTVGDVVESSTCNCSNHPGDIGLRVYTKATAAMRCADFAEFGGDAKYAIKVKVRYEDAGYYVADEPYTPEFVRCFKFEVIGTPVTTYQFD